MQTTKNTATIWRTGFLWITTCFRVNRDAVTGGENRGHPILGRARIPTEHVDLKAPFMKEIPFSTSVATQRGQGRDQSRRGRGRIGQGHDGTHEHPVYLADKINEICRSFDDLDLGDKEEIAGPNKCG